MIIVYYTTISLNFVTIDLFTFLHIHYVYTKAVLVFKVRKLSYCNKTLCFSHHSIISHSKSVCTQWVTGATWVTKEIRAITRNKSLSWGLNHTLLQHGSYCLTSVQASYCTVSYRNFHLQSNWHKIRSSLFVFEIYFK